MPGTDYCRGITGPRLCPVGVGGWKIPRFRLLILETQARGPLLFRCARR